MAYDIFISYSRKDGEIVERIKKEFDNNNILYWVDKDNIIKGEAYAAVISQAIYECKTVVFIWSEASNISPNTANEITLAIEFKKRIIPFKVTELTEPSEITFHLLKMDRIDAVPDVCNEHIKELVNSIIGSKGINSSEYDEKAKIKPVVNQKTFVKQIRIGILIILGFILFTIIGFFHTRYLSSDIDNLALVARSRVTFLNDSLIAYSGFPKEVILYNLSTNTVSVVNSENMNIKQSGIEEKASIFAMGVLFTKLTKVKAGGKNQVLVYVGGTLAIICGYGLGYYIFEKYYPISESECIKKFLSEPINWKRYIVSPMKLDNIIKQLGGTK